MTNETKELFDAPFAVMGDSTDYTKFNVIIHSRKSPRYCSTVASCIDQKTAIRFARLPELYDALMDEAIEKCNECLHENLRMGRIPFTGKYDFVEAGCPFKDEECHTASHLNLLKKVRDGE